VAVVSVGQDDGVVVVGAADGADGAGFLAGVDVAEAADLGLLVSLHRACLELADELHHPKPRHERVVGKLIRKSGLRFALASGRGLRHCVPLCG